MNLNAYFSYFNEYLECIPRKYSKNVSMNAEHHRLSISLLYL